MHSSDSINLSVENEGLCDARSSEASGAQCTLGEPMKAHGREVVGEQRDLVDARVPLRFPLYSRGPVRNPRGPKIPQYRGGSQGT